MRERSRERHWLPKYIKIAILDQDKGPKKPIKLLTVTRSTCLGKKHKTRQIYRDVFSSFPAQFPTLCGWRTSWASCWFPRLLFHCSWWTFLPSVFPSMFYTCIYFCPSVSSANEFHHLTRICAGKKPQHFLLSVLTPLPCHFVWFLLIPVFLEILNNFSLHFFSLWCFQFSVPLTFSPRCPFSRLANPDQFSLFFEHHPCHCIQTFSSSTLF